MITESLKLVTTKDGEQVAVWKVFDSRVFNHDNSNHNSRDTAGHPTANGQNILLTHGTFSDKHTCLRIAEYLAKLGHACYIMEWRGHGHSPLPKDEFNFETIATYDFAATFCYLFDELKLDNLHCVTHSGGGVGLTMFLVQNPRYIDKINSSTMFACQAYGAVVSRQNYVKILAAKVFTRVFGYIPAKRLKLGPVNENYYTMNQWYDWNLQKNFQSSFIKQSDNFKSNIISIDEEFNHDESFDYRQHMPLITTPIYAISAKGDNLISPTAGCQLFFDDFDNPASVFREYSISNGDLEDYSHSRIMISRNAAKEVWPTVAAWIEKHTK